ncbi:MAG: hypothetical protein R6U21_05060 [Thermoplasmatota archaeon]
MDNDKIVIDIPKEKKDLLKKLGLSAQDVFYRGLQESLRQRYRELNLMEDDDEQEEIELIDAASFTKEIREIEDFMVSENDIANN